MIMDLHLLEISKKYVSVEIGTEKRKIWLMNEKFATQNLDLSYLDYTWVKFKLKRILREIEPCVKSYHILKQYSDK